MNCQKKRWKKRLFWFCEGRLLCRAKPNVPFVRLAKRNFKKCPEFIGINSWLAFSFFLSPVPMAKYGQQNCLSMRLIWFLCSFHIQSLSCCVVCLFSIGGNVLAKKRAGFGTGLCQPSTEICYVFECSFYLVNPHVFLAYVSNCSPLFSI